MTAHKRRGVLRAIARKANCKAFFCLNFFNSLSTDVSPFTVLFVGGATPDDAGVDFPGVVSVGIGATVVDEEAAPL